MHRLRHHALRCILLSLATLWPLTAAAAADPAIVFNLGNTPAAGTACHISLLDGFYVGSVTEVFVGGTETLQCHASLVGGTPVAQTVRLTAGSCTTVVTPSGEANAICRTPGLSPA